MSATGLLTNLGAQVFQPFIPLYLHNLNATVPQIGLIYVGLAIAGNVSIFGGILADKVGRKSTIVLGGSVGFGLFLGLLGVKSLLVAALILFSGYFFVAMVQPAVTSSIAESVTLKDRSEAFGSFFVLASLGLAIGYPIGGYLPNPGRFELNILIIGIVGIGATLTRLIFLRETLTPKARVSLTKPGNRLFFTDLPRKVWLVMVALVLANFSSGLGLAIFPLFSTQQLKLSVGEFGIMGGMAALASMLGAIGAGRVSKRVGVKKMMIFAITLSAVLLIPWIFASNVFLAICFYSVSGFFAEFFLIGNQALMSNITSIKQRGSIIGFITTVAGLSGVVAPYVGSELWVLFSPRMPFLISILLSVLVAIPLLMVHESPRARFGS